MSITEEAKFVHGRAMLVNLNISQWTARQVDRKASKEVADNHNMTGGKGAFYKSLIEGKSLDEIKRLVNRAREEHYRRTLPWSDNGPRILSNLGYLDYMLAMGDYETKFRQLVGQFIGDYPALRAQAVSKLGSLFNLDDYPDIGQIGAKFAFNVSVLPLPKGDDFRCDIGADEVARIREEIERNTFGAVTDSMADAFQRVADVVEHFCEKLGDEEAVFRDSLVAKANDLADLLPSLNITNDQRLADYSQRLRDKLGSAQPAKLRTDPAFRRETYNEAMAMKKELMSFFGGAL